MGITSGKGQTILMCNRLSLEKCQVGQKRKGIWSKKKLMPLIAKWGGCDDILNAGGTRKMAISTKPQPTQSQATQTQPLPNQFQETQECQATY